MTTNRSTAIIAVTAFAWLVGCSTGAPEQVAALPEVDDRAVPVADSDQGASSDDAGTAGTIGTVADARGVAGSPLTDAEGLELTMVIYFDFDSSEVHPDDRIVVEAHAQVLAGDSGAEVVLEGHADAAEIGRDHLGERAVVLDHQEAGDGAVAFHRRAVPSPCSSYPSANWSKPAKSSRSLTMRGTLFWPPSLPRLFIQAAKPPGRRKRTRGVSMP